MRKVVYVAHPFSGKKENIDKVEKLIIEMVRQYPDFVFYSPLHGTGFYYFDKPYEEGMKDCIEILSRCDELWLCKGWEKSRGCNIEKAWAEEHRMPIKYWEWNGRTGQYSCGKLTAGQKHTRQLGESTHEDYKP